MNLKKIEIRKKYLKIRNNLSFTRRIIAEKKVFQKKNPASEKINKQKIKNGLVITIGIDHPMPDNPDTA